MSAAPEVRPEEVAAAARMLAAAGLVEAFGHVSARTPGGFLITSTRPMQDARAEDVIEVRGGRPVSGPAEALPMEAPLHAAVYGARPDAEAVCRGHPPYAAVWGAGAEALPLLHGLGGMSGAAAPVHPDLELIKTPEQAEAAAGALGGGWSLLLRANGCLTVGGDLLEAAVRLWFLEERARIAVQARRAGVAPEEGSSAWSRRLEDSDAELVRAKAWFLSAYGSPRTGLAGGRGAAAAGAEQLDNRPAMTGEEADGFRADFVEHLCQTVPGIKETVIVDAAGCSLKTAEGRILLDMISGIAVSNVGHCHPAVVEAVRRQAGRFAHVDVYGRFTLPPQVEIARRLASVTPDGLDKAFLTSTGTEATEGALKLARKYTGRPGFTAFEQSFHGRTFGALSVTWKEEWRKPFEPLLGPVRFAPFDDLDAAAEAVGEDTAAVIVEPIQGEGGVRVPSEDFLPGLRELCTERGALLICDEVQGGMGRSGRWFSCQNWGVTPDIITVAKAFGGGLPLGAFISTEEIFATFLDPPLSHLTTFGGNPVSCAAAAAAFDVIQSEGLVERSRELGRYLRAGLREAAQRHPGAVAEVRGAGLWCAFDVTPPELAQPLVEEMLHRGVVAGSMLNSAGTIRVAPPLVIERTEIDRFLAVLASSLDATADSH